MKTRELTLEEQEALTKDLTEVLEKHNADLGVVASIQILKRVEESLETKSEEIASPYVENGESTSTETETTTTD